MTVDLVSFYGSIISVSFNDKEQLAEVGYVQGLDIHRESIVRKRGTCAWDTNLLNKTVFIQILLLKPRDPRQFSLTTADMLGHSQ